MNQIILSEQEIIEQINTLRSQAINESTFINTVLDYFEENFPLELEEWHEEWLENKKWEWADRED